MSFSNGLGAPPTIPGCFRPEGGFLDSLFSLPHHQTPERVPWLPPLAQFQLGKACRRHLLGFPSEAYQGGLQSFCLTSAAFLESSIWHPTIPSTNPMDHWSGVGFWGGCHAPPRVWLSPLGLRGGPAKLWLTSGVPASLPVIFSCHGMDGGSRKRPDTTNLLPACLRKEGRMEAIS